MRDSRTRHEAGGVIRKMTAACLLAGTVLAAGGCGASSTPSLSAGRAAGWHDTIAAIRAAAAAADRPTALAALTRMSGYVDRDAQAGQLAAADAAALKAGIAQARRHLPQPATTPATGGGTQAQPSPTTAAAPPAASESPGTSNGVAQGQNNDAKTPKDAGNTKKDAAKAQKDAAKAQKDDAKPPKKQDKASQSGAVVLTDDGVAQNREAATSGTKAEPKKVTAPNAAGQGVQQ